MASKRVVLAALAVVVGFSGFAGLGPLNAAAAAIHDVSAQGSVFVPKTLSIPSGDSVRWTNNDPVDHTVTADDGSFDSGTLGPGQVYTRPFSASGTVHYYCRFHGSPGGAGMSGTITVGGGGGGTPTIAVRDAKVTEGAAGTTKNAVFVVTRSGSTAGTSTVKYSTANGTATAGSDYRAVSSKTLTFAAGITKMKAKVRVFGDNVVEPNETFSLNLSSPTGATITDGTAVGTITNDD